MLPCTAWLKNERAIVDTMDGVEYALRQVHRQPERAVQPARDDPKQQKNLRSASRAKVRRVLRRHAEYIQKKH